jgi:hypothetical protein
MRGDFSGVCGYAGFMPNGEVTEPVVVTLTPQEQEAVLQGQLSSCVGEIRTAKLVMQAYLERYPHVFKGKRVVYGCDGQSAVAAYTNMSGNPAVHAEVRELYELVLAADVQLDMQWHPREEELQAVADAWSKVTDNSQWGLNNDVYREYIDPGHPLVAARGGITLDVFGDNVMAKCKRFYSRYAVPGSLGVDGMVQPWALDQVTGERELCLVNGDFSRMGDILRKVVAERADCVIVYPDWPRYWQVLWAQMPVRDCYTLPRRNDLCVPGPRVDPAKRRGRPPNYKIKVAIVIWD